MTTVQFVTIVPAWVVKSGRWKSDKLVNNFSVKICNRCMSAKHNKGKINFSKFETIAVYTW